jgi:hypothetical protein
MAHDVKNQDLKVGDIVLVPCRIVSDNKQHAGGNLLVETVCDPEGQDKYNVRSSFVVNSKQCAKAE